MSYKYIAKGDVERNYEDGVSVIDVSLHNEFSDVKELGIEFYRVSLKAGTSFEPELKSDQIAVLCFNGKEAYVSDPVASHVITAPSFYVPDFARYRYTVGAIEDIEFILCYFPMNDWDWKHYWDTHPTLPMFKTQYDGAPYDQDVKREGTKSWSILADTQLGHIMVGVVQAIGSGTDEKGHHHVHQWNYCLGNSDFDLEVEDESAPQKPGDFSFIYAGKDHKLIAKPEKEVYYVWIEYFTVEDLDIFSEFSHKNKTNAEAYEEVMRRRKEK